MKNLWTTGWAGAALVAVGCSSAGQESPGGPDASKPDATSPATDAADARAPRDARPDAPRDAGLDAGPALNPGEYCTGGTPTIRFDPATVVVAAGKTRPVRAIVEPDLCSPTTISFSSSNGALVPVPPSGPLDLRHPTYDFVVRAEPGDAGVSGSSPTATLTATIPASDAGAGGTATLPVFVNDGALPACAPSDVATSTLGGTATTLSGKGGVAAAELSVPPGAFARTDELAIPSFQATVACAGDDLTAVKAASGSAKGHAAAPGSLVSIGPAVTFTAGAPIDMTHSLRRELDFSIPVNPAAIPTSGRLRHLQVLFMSPAASGVASVPRAITIANPQLTQTSSGAWVVQFSSPWFGTYQAAFSPDAGTVTRTRHLTHRAVFGFSMGSGGASVFGFRHHDQFDVIAPLGGPSDWTWFLWFIEKFNLGGFCAQTDPAYPDCPSYAPNLYPFHETYAHTVDFNHWYYEQGGGNGGGFSRASLAQMFDDLSLMHGNPNGRNADPALSFFSAGPTATDPWVSGGDAGAPGSCAVVTSPLDPDPNPADPPSSVQETWWNVCTPARCNPANTWTAPTGYYDGEYNPTGSFPVISFCESGTQIAAASPYEDTWTAPTAGNAFPLDMALAVDLNGNGVRDENEPVLRQGHEPWQDVGVDGVADVDEPGYDPVTNPDPNQDDYDFQLNPGGTEGNHHYDVGEPFSDYGLDGVPNTKSSPYDYGEGDGVFTVSPGLANFFADDPHAILHQWSTGIPGGAMTDDELLRLSLLTDGGERDLFNFAAVANHLIGAVASRKWPAGTTDSGTQLRSTAFYDGFDKLPGQVVGNELAFNINSMVWSDLVDMPHIRYGSVDATPDMIAQGDGQHVGTANQLLDRLQMGVYFAVQQWPDADRTLTYTVPEGDAGAVPDGGSVTSNCPGGLCSFTFSAANHEAPVSVQLPPGYILPENAQRNVRYPVVYALHGYGMTESGLQAAALVSTNNMDDPARSSATRIGKAILVYVDGRCRFSSDSTPQPECIQGSFWMNSPRPDPAHPGTNLGQWDTWFDALLTYIDQNFRTMPPSDVEVTE